MTTTEHNTACVAAYEATGVLESVRNNPKGRPPTLEHPRTVTVNGKVSQEVADFIARYSKNGTWGTRLETMVRELLNRE